MTEPILLARVLEEDGRIRVLAPRVGLWSSHPRPGALLGPGSEAGRLEVLNRRFAIRLPDAVRGRVVGSLPQDLVVPVEFGETLFELAPLGSADEAAAVDGVPSSNGATGSARAMDGACAIPAPTDGVFYRAPSPGAAPFVAPGDRIRRGQPFGLIEVMKTFNQILYDGPEFPDEAEVLEFRCADGEEVRAGAVLLVVR